MTDLNGFIAHPGRVLLGIFAAPLVPSLAAEIPAFKFLDFWPLLFLGFFAVLVPFLPLVLWRLRRTRHPFWACVLIGGLSAPGLLGYIVAIFATLGGFPTVLPMLMAITFPLGAIGGAVFWLCVVWRSDGWDFVEG